MALSVEGLVRRRDLLLPGLWAILQNHQDIVGEIIIPQGGQTLTVILYRLDGRLEGFLMPKKQLEDHEYGFFAPMLTAAIDRLSK